MTTIRLILCVSTLIGCAACSSTKDVTSGGDDITTSFDESPWEGKYAGDIRNELLAAMVEMWWELQVERSPTWATYLNDPRYHGRLDDISPEATERHLVAVEGFLETARDIDTTGLTPSERITLELLIESWEVDLARAATGIELETWNINPRGGPQNELLTLAADQPVASDAQIEQVFERWRAIPVHVDQHVSNLRRGMQNGRVASHHAVAETVQQLDELLATPVAESALLAPTRTKFAASHSWRTEFESRLTRLVQDEIYPAFGRYRDFLRDEVQPRSRPDAHPGVMHVPGGREYYEVAIREHTSLDLPPHEIHEIGLQEVRRVRREMSELGQRVFGTSDVAEIQKRLRTDPDLHFRTAEEVETVARETLARANAAAPASFGILPKAECIVVPIPEHEAPYTTIAYYRGPAADGSRPGRYYINTYQPETRPRYEAEVLALHEAVPGHHTQIAIAMELSALPLVRRHFSSTAYVEGWGLYTERLGDEMGLYSGDLDRLGVLSFDAWRACRLVVDTGLHSLDWSRGKAIDYMARNTLLAENNVENEVDRYIAWPGQALAYKLGQLEILRLRAEAEEAFGDRFSLEDFHDRVLESGAVTLKVLRRRIEQWIAEDAR